MANAEAPRSIDEYITRFPPDTQRVLTELLGLIRASADGTTETIAYGMPTIDIGVKHVLHFAGFSKHVALYPVPDWVGTFGDEVTPYKTGQGTLQFPLDKPLPADLIRRVVDFSVTHTRADPE